MLMEDVSKLLTHVKNILKMDFVLNAILVVNLLEDFAAQSLQFLPSKIVNMQMNMDALLATKDFI